MKYLNYILIVIGAVVALYANSNKEQNVFILIGGIVLLMVGVYRISKTIPSRYDREDESKSED